MIRTFSQPGIRKVITNRKINIPSGIIFLMLVAVLVSVVVVWLKGNLGDAWLASTPPLRTLLLSHSGRFTSADGKTEDGFRFA